MIPIITITLLSIKPTSLVPNYLPRCIFTSLRLVSGIQLVSTNNKFQTKHTGYSIETNAFPYPSFLFMVPKCHPLDQNPTFIPWLVALLVHAPHSILYRLLDSIFIMLSPSVISLSHSHPHSRIHYLLLGLLYEPINFSIYSSLISPPIYLSQIYKIDLSKVHLWLFYISPNF